MNVKKLFIPGKDNKYIPGIIGYKALVAYAFLSVAVFALICPFFIGMHKLLADLTQELVIQQVNPVREEYGFLALKANEKLTAAAQMKADDMIKKGYFSHEDPDGQPPWIWLKNADYHYAAAAENLAVDVSNPKVLVDAWLNSPSHAKNIMNGYFTDVGVGIAKGELLGRKTTVVVMYLGREIPQVIQLASSVIENAKNAVSKPENLNVTPEESVKDTPPAEPVVTQTVQSDILYDDNVAMTINTEGDKEEKISQNAGAKIFLINDFPFRARSVLTVFFSIIIFWTFATLLVSKEKFLYRAFNSLIILAFLFFLWLPEIV